MSGWKASKALNLKEALYALHWRTVVLMRKAPALAAQLLEALVSISIRYQAVPRTLDLVRLKCLRYSVRSYVPSDVEEEASVDVEEGSLQTRCQKGRLRPWGMRRMKHLLKSRWRSRGAVAASPIISCVKAGKRPLRTKESGFTHIEENKSASAPGEGDDNVDPEAEEDEQEYSQTFTANSEGQPKSYIPNKKKHTQTSTANGESQPECYTPTLPEYNKKRNGTW